MGPSNILLDYSPRLTFTIIAGRCVKKCKKMPNGVFQHCKKCNQYLSCYNKTTTIVKCAKGKQWDDLRKECVMEGYSETCNPGPDGK